ncbi:MAG TPA: hypothetical protein VMB71_06515 [Acetobacteraceae bacterium]|nr:hypothetical protein [Acetobacteraceae bacterium]
MANDLARMKGWDDNRPDGQVQPHGRRRSFLKKRTKKLLLLAHALPACMEVLEKKKFFASFFQKRSPSFLR